MLSENKNIDQIFSEKLGDYQKTPPVFLWTNIQQGLNTHRKARRFALLKTAGIAAAVLLAFLAGWRLTNPDRNDLASQNTIAVQQDVNQKIETSVGKNNNPVNLLPADSGLVASNTSESATKANPSGTSKLSSLATFGANTTFIRNGELISAQKPNELVLFSTEKDFLDQLDPNFKVVRKLAEWIATVGHDSVIAVKDSKQLNTNPLKYKPSEASAAIAVNNPVRKNAGRWSLKAEFAPVFNSQPQNSAQRNNLLSYSSQIGKPKETTAENTFSGGMVAGYKVGKRLIIKSGVVYNNIRQTTRNIDFMEVNPLYNVPGNTSIASTPAGQVSLNKMANTRSATVLNSNYQFSDAAKYSAENELKQDIEFIEIPVQATYKLIDRQFNVGLTGGISTNILIGNRAIFSENGENISNGETANMRNFVYSGAVGLELGYEITNRITLTVEPRIKQYISSLSANESVSYKPSQVEIVTGLTYCFN